MRCRRLEDMENTSKRVPGQSPGTMCWRVAIRAWSPLFLIFIGKYIRDSFRFDMGTRLLSAPSWEESPPAHFRAFATVEARGTSTFKLRTLSCSEGCLPHPFCLIVLAWRDMLLENYKWTKLRSTGCLAKKETHPQRLSSLVQSCAHHGRQSERSATYGCIAKTGISYVLTVRRCGKKMFYVLASLIEIAFTPIWLRMLLGRLQDFVQGILKSRSAQFSTAKTLTL